MALRVGIVGCGRVMDSHIAALKKIKDVKLAAVCDLNEELAKQAASSYSIDRFYTDFSELLKEKPDIIHITTPPQTHLPLSVQAMEAGCHVLIEKPLALTVDDVDKMAEAAGKNNVCLSAVHNALFVPVIARVKKLIQSSIIGELLQVEVIMTGKDTELMLNRSHWCHRMQGGIFGELLPHPLYLAEAFIDDLRVVKVNSLKFGTYEWLEVDEVRIMLEGGNCTASIVCSLNVPDIYCVNFIGTKGYLHVPVSRGAITSHFPSDNLFIKGWGNVRTSCQWINATIGMAIMHMFNQSHDGHYYLIKEFVDAVRKGGEPPVSLESARNVTKLYQEVTNLIPTGK